MKIWFDMDGTIANLYGVDNWLEKLRNFDASPYACAKPLLNLSLLARLLHKAQVNGHKVGIISWLSKNSNFDYDNKVTLAKMEWLRIHLPSVEWDTIHIVPYGMNKKTICGDGILFDDEEKNRNNWGNGAHTPNEIIEVLKAV